MSAEPTGALGARNSHMLKARGVDVIFGIPGVYNQDMYRGIEKAGIGPALCAHVRIRRGWTDPDLPDARHVDG